MFRFFISVLPFTLLSADCTHTKSSKEKRRDLIENAIVALKAYDTAQLFRILDTADVFKFWGKEMIMHRIEYVNSRFKTCSSTLPDSIVEKRVYNLPVMEYILPFCRDSSGKAVSTSFDLVFTFADYVGDSKIVDMKVEKYLLKVDSPKIAPPIPVPQN